MQEQELHEHDDSAAPKKTPLQRYKEDHQDKPIFFLGRKQDIKDEAIEDLSQMAKDAWQIIAKENRSKPQFFLSNNKPAYLSIKEQVDLQLLTPAMPQPTPLPPVAPQDSRIQTTVDGIDHIETKAILPEHLVVDQLDAIKKIADNGTLIAQQRFAVEQYKINSDAQLEWLRIAKGFTLWGFLFSVPFLIKNTEPVISLAIILFISGTKFHARKRTDPKHPTHESPRNNL